MKKLIFLITISFLTGCATLKDARDEKGTGQVETYERKTDLVWSSTIKIVEESDLDLVSKDKEDGLILGQRGMTAFSYGENVAIFIEPKGESNTTVEIVSKRALATNITARNWASYIHEKLKELFSSEMNKSAELQ